MKITPAILTDSFLTLQQQVEAVRYSSLLSTIEIDVIDGQFTENVTVTPLDITVAEFVPAKLSFHLMVEEPMDFVYECESLKEYLPIERLVGQVERMSHQSDFISQVKSNGWKAGLGLDLFTPLESIDPECWGMIDCVQLLAVEAGAQGQTLHPYIFDKLHELLRTFPQRTFQVIVDGGIKEGSMTQLRDAQVDEAVIGSALWQSHDPVMTLEHLHQVVSK